MGIVNGPSEQSAELAESVNDPFYSRIGRPVPSESPNSSPSLPSLHTPRPPSADDSDSGSGRDTPRPTRTPVLEDPILPPPAVIRTSSITETTTRTRQQPAPPPFSPTWMTGSNAVTGPSTFRSPDSDDPLSPRSMSPPYTSSTLPFLSRPVTDIPSSRSSWNPGPANALAGPSTFRAPPIVSQYSNIARPRPVHLPASGITSRPPDRMDPMRKPSNFSSSSKAPLSTDILPERATICFLGLPCSRQPGRSMFTYLYTSEPLCHLRGASGSASALRLEDSMEDLMKTGLGGEATDQSYVVRAGPKPVWHFNPLPLDQLRPPLYHRPLTRGPVQSLHSHCLATVSRNFHLFTPSTFLGVPTLLVRRILSRVRADRRYEISRGMTPNFRPDEATIWCYSVLVDPEGTEESHTLALPMSSTLIHLPHNPLSAHPEHPLVALPKLYQTLQPQAQLWLLTTLTLDGMDAVVSDSTVLALKWCTHLTALWMKGCKVTDAGIRFLASALELPGDGTSGQEARGMWRLRAWYLRGCTGVSDRSMKALARWPGLVVLDTRETSCTSTSIGIFNRSSQALFGGANADFQPCTDGLVPLFGIKSNSSDILDNLCLTLLASSTPHLALHIIPSSRLIPPEHLPNPMSDPRKTTHDPITYQQTGRKDTVYRAGGIGQIYGTNVSSVEDTVQAFRSNVRVALMLQAEEDEEDRRLASGKRKKKEKPREYKRPMSHVRGKVLKEQERKGANADTRSKAFVSGGVRVGNESQVEVVGGDRELMMVRMVADGWERLVWASGSAAANARAPSIDSSSQSSRSVASTQRSRRGDLVESIMAATRPAPTPSVPFRPTLKIIDDPSSSQLSLPMELSRDPFRRPVSATLPPMASPFTDKQNEDNLSFSCGTPLKRAFNGGSAGETTRKGLKMFGGAR